MNNVRVRLKVEQDRLIVELVKMLDNTTESVLSSSSLSLYDLVPMDQMASHMAQKKTFSEHYSEQQIFDKMMKDPELP